MKIRLILPLLCVAISTFGQHELTMPFFQNVYQSSYGNPTHIPDHDASFSISPFGASSYFNYQNTSFSLSDIIENDTIYINQLDDIVKENNYIYTSFTYEWLSVMVKVKKFHFSFNVTENFRSQFAYTEGLIDILANGNAGGINVAEGVRTEEVSLEDIGLDVSHYREYALGVAFPFSETIELGFRGKFLFGKANLWTARSKNKLTSSPYDVQLDGDLELRTSVPSYMEDDDISEQDIENYMFNTLNPGFALDASIMWRPGVDNKWEFTAVITDLGFIRWNDNAKKHTIVGSGQFVGVDESFIVNENPDEIGGASVDPDISTAVEDSFEIVESPEAYTNWLSAQNLFMATYRINKNFKAGGGLFLEYFQGVRPSFTTNFQARLKHFESIISYSIRNGSYFNLGLGASMTLGPVQMYFCTDNILATFLPDRARLVNLRTGINFVIGHKKYYKSKKDLLDPYNNSFQD